MVFLSHSFVGTRVLKVLVVPIGENSLFDAHFDLISRMKFLPKEEISYSNSMLSKSQAFRNFQWDEGNFVFDYVRYDVAKGGSDLADYLDSSQRVLIVLGLINHPELGESSDNMEDELKFFSRNYPFISVRRLIVFNYEIGLTVNPSRANLDEDIALLRPLSDDPESLILCPTEGDSKEMLTVERKEHSSSSAVLSVVESRLKSMLANIAVIVFESLQKEMRVCEGSRFAGSFPPWLITAMKRPRSKPSDDDEASSANPSLNNSSGLMILTKKVLSGRLRKFMGDLCLQVCSPVDAIHQYTAAVTESRASLDLLWLASALEGYAAAVLTLLSHKPSAAIIEEVLGSELKVFKSVAPVATKNLAYRLISAPVVKDSAVDTSEHQGEDGVERNAAKIALDRCMEALSIYSNYVLYSYKEASCSLRLARMIDELGPLAMASVFERHTKMSTYVLRAVSVPGLTPAQRVEVTADGAVVFRRAGLERKYGLLLYMAGLMGAESGNGQTGQILMQKSVAQYGVLMRTSSHSSDNKNDDAKKGISGSELDNAVETEERQERESMYTGTVAWTSMRLQLLAHITHISRENGDFNAAATTLCAMIRLMGALEARQQEQLSAWSSSTVLPERDFVREREDFLGGDGSRGSPYGDLQSELGDEGIRCVVEDIGVSSVGRLLGSIEGRRQLSTELMNYRYRQHSNGQLRTGPPILSASNISRLVGTPSGKSVSAKSMFGAPGSTEKPPRALHRSASTSSQLSSSGAGGMGMGAGAEPVVKRGSGSVHSALSIADLDTKHTSFVTPVGAGTPGSAMSRYSLGPNAGALVPHRPSFSIVKGERKEMSKYDDRTDDNSPNDKNRRRSNGSTMTSISNFRKSQNASVAGSVSSSSCYTVFSPPSILGISEITERRRKRIQQNKKKKPHSAAGRLINAQLQSYQSFSNTASGAANFLSTMLLPDGQSTVPSNKIGVQNATPLGILQTGANMSQMSINRVKLPSASRISSLVLNSAPGRVTPPAPAPGPGPKTPPSTPDTTTTMNTSSSMREREELSLIVEGDEGYTVDDMPPSCLSRCLDSLSRMLFEGGVSSAQQEQGIELLEQLSREVPPDSALLLPFITMSVRPLNLQGPEAPLKGTADEQKRWEAARLQAEKERKIKESKLAALKAGSAGVAHVNGTPLDANNDIDDKDKGQGKASALFYDPFEARRARDTGSSLRASVLWSVGATCTAEVVFKNPLCCPLYLTALTLLADGVEFVATPRSVVIPPRTDGIAVELSITPLAEGVLKIIGVELSIHNAVHRMYTDSYGNIRPESELPSPWGYLYRVQEGGPQADKKAAAKRGASAVRSNAGGGVETTMITVAPAAPSLDLLPGWETQHMESESSVHHDVFPRDKEGTGAEFDSGYTDRVVSLSLCPGEKRVECVYAVLQPLLTGVFPVFKDDLVTHSNHNGDVNNGDVKGNVNGNENGNVNGNQNGNGDDEGGCTVADDMRITVHQWTSTQSSSSSSFTSSSASSSPRTLDRVAHHTENVLLKTTSLQRDFLGPLKNITSKTKSNIPSDISCKLIRLIKNNRKRSGKNTINYGELNVLKDMPSSLSLPLELEFEFSRGVVGYRIDVETLAQDSNQIPSSSGSGSSSKSGSGGNSSKEVKPQLYLRRSSLYVRIQPNPSVDLLSSSFLTLVTPKAVSDITATSTSTATASMNAVTSSTTTRTPAAINTDINTPSLTNDNIINKGNKFIVLKLRNSSRQLAVVSTSHAAARSVLMGHIMRSRDRNINHPLHSSSNSSNHNTHALESDPESFSEFLEPESTKNLIIPMHIWEKRDIKNSSSPSGLYWALYDSFSSSIVPILCYSNSSTDSSIQGSIRTGAVLGIETPKGPPVFSKLFTPILPGLLNPDPGSKIDINTNLKASVLLFQKNVLVFENTYTVNTKNNFKCVLWEEYDLHLKISCSDINAFNSDVLTNLSSRLDSSNANTESNSNSNSKAQGAQYEVSLVIRLVPEIGASNTEHGNENEVLINGKTRFNVYGGLSQGTATANSVTTSIEKLHICFPIPGVFSIQVMYRDLKSKNSIDDKLHPLSTVFVQVQ